MTFLHRGLAALCAVVALAGAAPAFAQGKVQAPAGFVPAQAMCLGAVGSDAVCADALAVQSYGGGAPVSVVRPNNTTTYGANTGWANATSGATYLTFSNVCRANGGTVLLTDLLVTLNANQSTKLSGILWLFDTAPASPVNDNATFSIASGDLANLKTYITFSPATVANQGAGASGSVADVQSSLGRQVKCASGTRHLYGLVQATNAYVPTGPETLGFILRFVGVN